MDRRVNLSPQGQATKVVVDFLEVAITSILFHKRVYPPGMTAFLCTGMRNKRKKALRRTLTATILAVVNCAFERRKYMNLVVHKAIHPELQDYIHSAVHGLFSFIEKGEVDRVAVVFFDANNTPFERYIFKLQVNQSYGSKVEEADLGFALRSFILKLSLSKGYTKILAKDSRWEIIAYFSSDTKANGRKDVELWIPTDTKQWEQPPQITPLKSMNSESLVLQLYLEHPTLPEPPSSNIEG